jgi:predicted RNA binding protein YcfA (HicA-like mRNA interferase family)
VNLKGYSSKEILKQLYKDGWEIKNQAGSHIQLVHPTKQDKVTVPHHRKDLPERTVKSILKQAGLM